jgi:hypothetical protein
MEIESRPNVLRDGRLALLVSVDVDILAPHNTRYSLL